MHLSDLNHIINRHHNDEVTREDISNLISAVVKMREVITDLAESLDAEVNSRYQLVSHLVHAQQSRDSAIAGDARKVIGEKGRAESLAEWMNRWAPKSPEEG